MTGLEIWLLVVGLAMDCFAVSIASGIILKRARLRPMLVMVSASAFSGFDASAGMDRRQFFSHLIESIDHWIAFGILAFLGGRMIMESFKDEDCKHEYDPTSLKVVLALVSGNQHRCIGGRCFVCIPRYQAILGYSFPIGIIGFVSFALSMVSMMFGIRFGCGIARRLRAELWGGIILVIIGTKILVEHLFF